MRLVIGTSGLVALWLLMSGIYDKPLILAFGAASVVISLVIAYRMDSADGERLHIPISVWETLKYTIWLLIEIAKSNWSVTRIILSGKEPERQKLFMVPVTQKSEIGQVVFANSITLTPGTITVETENEQFIVHALDFGDEDMEGLAEMDRRVSKIETAGVMR